MKLILWAVGINGEGSSKVALNLIKSLFNSSLNNNFKIFISDKSSLAEELFSNNLLNKSQICILPKIYRIYPIQFFLKFFLPINSFCKGLITLDDYPFLNAKNQILYFHQPNLLFSEKFIWKIKRLVFNILLTKSLKVFLQTKHFRREFLVKFNNINSKNIIMAWHFDK